MKRIITIITFIPWFLYYYSETKSLLKIIKNNKENDTKESIFKLLPINNLVLYSVLIYFSIAYKNANNIFVVRILLFSAINIYLFFNTISEKDYILNINKKEERISFKYYVLAFIPILFYLITKKQMTTYYIMLIYNFFAYLFIKLVGLPKNEE